MVRLTLLQRALASIRWCCIPVMSHDNNARNFTSAAAAAAASGTTAVTPLISSWPTSASHTGLDRTQ